MLVFIPKLISRSEIHGRKDKVTDPSPFDRETVSFGRLGLLHAQRVVDPWPEPIPGGPHSADPELDDENCAEAGGQRLKQRVNDVACNFDLVKCRESSDDPDACLRCFRGKATE